MSYIDKLKINSQTYDMSPSPNGTLDTTQYSSSDVAQSSASAWSSVEKLNNTDSNKTIFSKISMMFKNIRYLYNVMGSGFTTSNTIYSQLSGKADTNHSHTTANLPVSSSQVNSNSYIPTSSLVYAMNESINSLNDAINDLEYQIDDPNDRYIDKSLIATWNNPSDIDTFLNRFNRSNAYNDGNSKLRTGNIIKINDGTYNMNWVIAGFDMEHNRTASDGTVYDNGYGICLVPETYVVNSKTWNDTNTLSGAYKASTMHNTHLPIISNNLKTILGNHLVNRNALLSSSVDSNYHSNAYTWTTSYLTLLSGCQLGNGTATTTNKYDDGEANYKLILFSDDSSRKTGSSFWTRGIWGDNSSYYYVWSVGAGGAFSGNGVGYSGSVRPLMYIR